MAKIQFYHSRITRKTVEDMKRNLTLLMKTSRYPSTFVLLYSVELLLISFVENSVSR